VNPRRGVGGTALFLAAFAATSLVSPATAVAAATSGRDAATDVNADQTNPCTGAVGDLVDRERDSWTVVSRDDGSTLLRGHSVARVTFQPYDASAESFAGEETFSDVESTSSGADTVHVTHRLRLHGTNGGVISLSEVLRVVVGPDGAVRVDVESMSMSCG
jgi:hypothetical protein